MDVSLSVRFTAAERWEKGAARRVLIDSDLWSEPSLAEAASDSYHEPRCISTHSLNLPDHCRDPQTIRLRVGLILLD